MARGKVSTCPKAVAFYALFRHVAECDLNCSVAWAGDLYPGEAIECARYEPLTRAYYDAECTCGECKSPWLGLPATPDPKADDDEWAVNSMRNHAISPYRTTG
jgi:hypothetical protein